MKKWLLILALAATGGTVLAQALDLRTEVDSLRDAVYRRGHRLPDYEQREVAMKLIEIRDYILNGGRPRPARGFYCTAACKNASGYPDLAYSAGAESQYEIEARNLAREEVRRKWSCNFGVVDSECSAIDGVERLCVATCRTVSGQADLTYAGAGSGRSEAQAKIAARDDVRRRYSCNYGIVDYDCSTSERPTYCVAACKSVSGVPDLNYSKGASGYGDLDAKFNAILEVKKTYSCNYGVGIHECE